MKKLRWIRTAAALGVIGVVTGCAAVASGDGSLAPRSAARVELGREDLGIGLNVLEGLDGRVSGLEVIRTPGECARIRLRGRGAHADEPLVYINGARAMDACILEDLPLRDVERIEVQAGAAPVVAGRLGGPGGVISIHLRSWTSVAASVGLRE